MAQKTFFFQMDLKDRAHIEKFYEAFVYGLVAKQEQLYVEDLRIQMTNGTDFIPFPPPEGTKEIPYIRLDAISKDHVAPMEDQMRIQTGLSIETATNAELVLIEKIITDLVKSSSHVKFSQNRMRAGDN